MPKINDYQTAQDPPEDQSRATQQEWLTASDKLGNGTTGYHNKERNMTIEIYEDNAGGIFITDQQRGKYWDMTGVIENKSGYQDASAAEKGDTDGWTTPQYDLDDRFLDQRDVTNGIRLVSRLDKNSNGNTWTVFVNNMGNNARRYLNMQELEYLDE